MVRIEPCHTKLYTTANTPYAHLPASNMNFRNVLVEWMAISVLRDDGTTFDGAAMPKDKVVGVNKQACTRSGSMHGCRRCFPPFPPLADSAKCIPRTPSLRRRW